jgi:uncharacterized circularly permuted ATP-grasp superfamily protein/uncharacterized alpha-E superfamily protein
MLNALLKSYPRSKTRHDELLDDEGKPRPQWRALLNQLAREAPEVMHQRLQTVQRQVRENGVTYNVYTDPKGSHRPWNLDVLPFILTADEWQGIEKAVTQRATLLNKILADVYGPQQMLDEALLPAGLIYGNASFLRPCHGIHHSDGVALHTYAVDLARAPDGKWWVVGDRTQAPSGSAYALENRQIISRAFPELFRELKIKDLGSYFATLRDSLDHWGRLCAANSGLGLRKGEQPLMVLLTPGPYNETYYEQSYLARYLGFPLVEGSDLTVRNGMVWLKTLSGLQRVHVILRRLDDDFCDPLELRPDSSIGVVGLTEAARRGNILIANGLGSNILESGALLGYLPKLCQRILNEPLLMPSVGTWWCGEPAALEEAIKRLDQLVIKPSFPQLREPPIFGQDLSVAGSEALIAKMRIRPQNYVAQELVHLSQAPMWHREAPTGLDALAIGLRVYACATPNGYVVMPGGLARVAGGVDARVINIQRGGASKDCWVQTTGKFTQPNLLHHATTSQELIRGDTHLSSRVVDNFFWFGRYAERCEHLVRLTRTALELRLQAASEDRSSEWLSIMALCQRFYLLDSPTHADAPNPVLAMTDAQIEAALIHSVVTPNIPGLASNLRDLFGVSFHLRERLSLDNWRKMNQMVQQIDHVTTEPLLADALIILDDTTTSLMTLSGFALDGMTRDQGWRFLLIGRWIERLQFLCKNIQTALVMAPESNLDWLLELADSIVTYRSRYMAKPEWLPTLDLLLLDQTNTRSIAFQLKGLNNYLNRLAQTHGPCGAELFEPVLGMMHALNPEHDFHRDSVPLAAFLDGINTASLAASEKIELRFFSNSDDGSNDAANSEGGIIAAFGDPDSIYNIVASEERL